MERSSKYGQGSNVFRQTTEGKKADKRYKAIGKGERTSHKKAKIIMTSGEDFTRENANQFYSPSGKYVPKYIPGTKNLNRSGKSYPVKGKSPDGIGGRDYTEKRVNRTDKYKKGATIKSGKKKVITPEEAYEQEQHDAMFNSQYGKGGATSTFEYCIGGL